MSHTEFHMQTSRLHTTSSIEDILCISDYFLFLILIETTTRHGAILEKTRPLRSEIFDKSWPDDFSIFDNEI